MGTGGGGGSCFVFCATAGATVNIAANKNRASAEINAGKECRVFLLVFINQPHAASSVVSGLLTNLVRRRPAARSLAMISNLAAIPIAQDCGLSSQLAPVNSWPLLVSVAARGVHHRRGLGQTLVDEDLNLHAAILGATRSSLVVSDGI